MGRHPGKNATPIGVSGFRASTEVPFTASSVGPGSEGDRIGSRTYHVVALACGPRDPAIGALPRRRGRPAIMEKAELLRVLDDTFDEAIVYHGFTAYMRDYEVVIYRTADPATGISPSHLRYLFRYCVSAEVETRSPALSGSSRWTRGSLTTKLVSIFRATCGGSGGS